MKAVKQINVKNLLKLETLSNQIIHSCVLFFGNFTDVSKYK